MSIFIPAIWSGKLLESLKKRHVYANLCNRNYEGEIIEQGDRVKISTISSITIGDYVKNQDMNEPEVVNGISQELVIDQAKYFNFQVDDVDAAQSKPKVMEGAINEASYGLADVSDQYVAGLLKAASTNVIGKDASPIVPTKENAYDYLVDLSVLLDEANVPADGRWVVVPSWYHGLLQKDNRFVASGAMPADDRLRTGFIGQAAGFNVHKSNNVPNTSGEKYKIIASYPGAISYAEQIRKLEMYRMEKRFAGGCKGLHLYGAKLTRPTGVAVLTANKA